MIDLRGKYHEENSFLHEHKASHYFPICLFSSLMHMVNRFVVFLLGVKQCPMTWSSLVQVVPSAPVLGDNDYSDPFDARLDLRPETIQSHIAPENNGYMEPYEAQKVITGQFDFSLNFICRICAEVTFRVCLHIINILKTELCSMWSK